MKAAQLVAPRRFELVDVGIAEPTANEIRINVMGCGVCASSLPLWEGRTWFQYPLSPGAPGHEAWGTVDAVGKSVTDFAIGDLVCALPDRGFAESMLAVRDQVCRLPASLLKYPFPGEAFGCAINVFRRSRIEAGETAVLVGTGFIGLLVTALAISVGAEVIAISRRNCSLRMAEKMGAKKILPFGDEAVEFVRCQTRGLGASCVIEATGVQEGIDLSTKLIAESGRLVIAGYHQDGRREIDLQRWNWLGIDVINAHERDTRKIIRAVEDAANKTAHKEWDPALVLTHRFRLDQMNEAFQALHIRPEGFIKGLMVID